MLGWQHSQKQGWPCRALAAERLVRMALPLPGTRPAPPGRMAQARQGHTCQDSWQELSVQRLWLVVCEYQKLVRYHTRDGGKS